MLGLPALFALGAAASTITPFGPRVVYTPPITYGYPGIQNPRTLQLRDGTLLATWENYAPEPPAAYFPIFRSRDGGYSWHHLSNVTDVYGWGLRYQPALYELPVDFAGYSNGTLLLAGNSIPVSQNSTQLVLYASEDQGLTWKFLSQIESGGQPEEDSRGLSSVTDPFILLYQDQLVVYYANTGSIMHKTSQDMINWSPSVLDAPNTGDTGWPAKPNVLELPDGRFMLAYEQGQAPDVMIQVTPAFYRITSNPLDFGNIPPESIQTKDGDMLVWAPRLAWSSIGGPSGVIIATGTWTHKLYFNRALGDPTAWENTTELLQPWADTTQWGPDIRNAMELRVFQEDPNALLLMTAGPTGPHPDINEYFNVSVSVSDLSVLLNIH